MKESPKKSDSSVNQPSAKSRFAERYNIALYTEPLPPFEPPPSPEKDAEDIRRFLAKYRSRSLTTPRS